MPAMNLAGPKSADPRQIDRCRSFKTACRIWRLTSFQLAGVPAIVLRIRICGELGYEIHVPANSPLIWEAIIEAGQDSRSSHFWIEAQRMLRLDKKHCCRRGPPTPLSNPWRRSPWIVKLDKEDFIGQSYAGRAQGWRRNRLIGFRSPTDLRHRRVSDPA